MPKMLILLTTILLMLSNQAQAHSNAPEDAALAWLEAIDSGQYEQAWESSSSILKKPLSPHMLERTIGAARRDFGAVQSRRRISVVRETSMPGAPRDDYAVLTFQTSFENRSPITETITPHLEEGTWRVSGYYVN